MTIITPAKPITTDASRTKVMRSPSNGQARKVTASGETKEMAIASVTPTYFAELKKKSVEPSRPAEQITCCTGERVRRSAKPVARQEDDAHQDEMHGEPDPHDLLEGIDAGQQLHEGVLHREQGAGDAHEQDAEPRPILPLGHPALQGRWHVTLIREDRMAGHELGLVGRMLVERAAFRQRRLVDHDPHVVLGIVGRDREALHRLGQLEAHRVDEITRAVSASAPAAASHACSPASACRRRRRDPTRAD